MDERAVSRIEAGKNPSLAASLARAFQDQPNFQYLEPDPRLREALLPWVFGVSVFRLALEYGVIHATAGNEGAAAWIAPGKEIGFRGALRAGMAQLPFRMGWLGTRRFLQLGQETGRLRRTHMQESHWYLMALGVDPTRQGKGWGAALLQPVLDRATDEGVPCYLETFGEKNLGFYQRFGFVVCGESHLQGGPRFWGMIRRPP